MRYIQFRTAMSLVLWLVAGCAGSAPEEVSLYLLRPATDALRAEVSNGSVVIGLGEVRVAPYLDDSGIMLELGDREIRPARYHRWAEPLSNSLAVVLSNNISSELGQPITDRTDVRTWDYRIDVYIDEFHGTRDGVAKLNATWTIISLSSEAADSQHRFASRERIPSEGYGALVDAHYRLTESLATAIANSLRPILNASETATTP